MPLSVAAYSEVPSAKTEYTSVLTGSPTLIEVHVVPSSLLLNTLLSVPAYKLAPMGVSENTGQPKKWPVQVVLLSSLWFLLFFLLFHAYRTPSSYAKGAIVPGWGMFPLSNAQVTPASRLL